MTPSEIESGMKFGHWEIIKYDHKDSRNRKYFLCKCDVCSTIRPVRADALISGNSTACSKQCNNNLIGQTFGLLTPFKIDKSQPNRYLCKCKCGNITSVSTYALLHGMCKSCGCLGPQKTKERYKNEAEQHIGETWYYLTIDDCYIEPKPSPHYMYRCTCKCGAKITVRKSDLLNGKQYSCGCVNSKANEIMTQILIKYNIPFEREYRFSDCRDKRPLPFDFALFNNQHELIGVMELNGIQHYSTAGTNWNSPERLVYQQKHDYIKRKFCEDGNLPFLVIPYQYFDELEKFLITSDFWKIIIKNFND